MGSKQTKNHESQITKHKKEPPRCEDCEFSVAAEAGGGLLFTCDQKRPGHRLIVRADEGCEKFVRSQDLLAPHLAEALAEGAKLIPLTQGRLAIVDADDYAELSRYKWCAVKTPYTCYAVRATRRRKRVKGRRTERKTVLMHRAITSAPNGLLVDHINHNGLDNRKKNLRLCTKSQNTRNQLPRPGCSSKYKGVSWKKRDKKFVAQITFKGKKIYLGSFDDEVAAAKAYDKKARELFGRFAYLNFPEE